MELGDVKDPEPGTINYIRLNGISESPPGIARNPSVLSGLEDIATNEILSWRPGEFAADVNGHKVYFGTDFNDINDSTSDYAMLSEPNFYPGTMSFNTTYYWRIDELNDPCIWKGDIWKFTTRSGSASNPYPANNMENIDPNVALGWRAGDQTADVNGHDIYIGIDSNAVKNAGATFLVGDVDGNGIVDWGDILVITNHWLEELGRSELSANIDGYGRVDFVDFAMMAENWRETGIYKGRYDVNSYAPCGLEYATTHFWRVDEINDVTTWGGRYLQLYHKS